MLNSILWEVNIVTIKPMDFHLCGTEDIKYVSHLKLEMGKIDIFCGMKLISTEVCFVHDVV